MHGSYEAKIMHPAIIGKSTPLALSCRKSGNQLRILLWTGRLWSISRLFESTWSGAMSGKISGLSNCTLGIE
jgi:hypothetical protein